MDDDLAQDQSDGGGLRRQLEAALARSKELEQSLPEAVKQAEERGAAQAQRRYDAKAVLGDLGFPGLADTWADKHPEGELTKESASEFLGGLGLQPSQPEPSPPVPAEVQQAAQAFQQPVAPGAASTMLERDEYLEMIKDPSRRGEALAALREGRVKLNNPKAYGASLGSLPTT